MKAEALVVMLAIAVLGGLLVLLLFPDYRIEKILESNAAYFPPPEATCAVVVTPAPTPISEAEAGAAEIEDVIEDLSPERAGP